MFEFIPSVMLVVNWRIKSF